MRHPVFIASVLLLAFIGCGGQSDREESGFQTTIEDGIPVIISPEQPDHTDTLFHFEKILTLHEDERNEESLLSDPRQIVIGSNGDFFVSDSGNYRIAVFDSIGQYKYSFGRRGSGPGEYQSGLRIIECKGDEIQTFDQQLQRLTIWTLGGVLLRTIPNRSLENMKYVDGMYEIAQGRILYFDSPQSSLDETRYSWCEGQIISTATGDTVASLVTQRVPAAHVDRSQGSPRTHQLQFAGTPSLFFHHHLGIYLTPGNSPEITQYDFNGEPVRRIRIAAEPQRVTGSMREDRRKQILDDREKASEELGRPLSTDLELYFSETIGFARNGLVDDRGYIWLLDAQLTQMRDSDRWQPYHIFSPDGRYLGITRVPAGYGISVRNGLLTIIHAELEIGAFTPSVYRITARKEGLVY
ncbi:6-bladed beta-propeller [Gemmatimonadota bacterium]